jgi:hypothetical protein
MLNRDALNERIVRETEGRFKQAVRLCRLREERPDADGRWLMRPWAAIQRSMQRQALMDGRQGSDEERLSYWFAIEPMGLVSLKDTDEVVRLAGTLAHYDAQKCASRVFAAVRTRIKEHPPC